MTKQNNSNKKKIIIFLFLFTFLVSIFLYSFQPTINDNNDNNSDNTDEYMMYWPIVDESNFNRTINNYDGGFDENKFENIFESIIIDSIGDDVSFEYIYNDNTIVNALYLGNEKITNKEHKYIFEVLENKDYN